MSQVLLLEGISFIRLLGERRPVYTQKQQTSVLRIRRKQLLCAYLGSPNRGDNLKEKEKKRKRDIQLQFSLYSSFGLRKHVFSLYKSLDSFRS